MEEQKLEQKIRYLDLFWTFFKLGLFTFGGGMAMIPLMQGLIQDKKKWMTEEEVLDCIAVSQALPGVIAINMATYIGKQKRGISGALVATFGVILPSFLIIIAVAELLKSLDGNRYVEGALTGIKAGVTGLIAYSAYSIGRKTLKDAAGWVLAAGSFVLVIFCGLNAVFVIVGGIAIGLIMEYAFPKKNGKEAAE